MDGISNGVVDNTCAKKVFSKCDFACNSGFIKNIGVTRATCSVNGTWSTNDVTACVRKYYKYMCVSSNNVIGDSGQKV